MQGYGSARLVAADAPNRHRLGGVHPVRKGWSLHGHDVISPRRCESRDALDAVAEKVAAHFRFIVVGSNALRGRLRWHFDDPTIMGIFPKLTCADADPNVSSFSPSLALDSNSNTRFAERSAE